MRFTSGLKEGHSIEEYIDPIETSAERVVNTGIDDAVGRTGTTLRVTTTRHMPRFGVFTHTPLRGHRPDTRGAFDAIEPVLFENHPGDSSRDMRLAFISGSIGVSNRHLASGHMTGEVTGGPSEALGFAAYERDTVERFFLDAQDERVRLLIEIAGARRRIAQAKAALVSADDTEYSRIATVLDAQHALRQEQRANDRAIAAVYADAEALAEQILREARDRERAARAVGSDQPGSLTSNPDGDRGVVGGLLGPSGRPLRLATTPPS